MVKGRATLPGVVSVGRETSGHLSHPPGYTTSVPQELCAYCPKPPTTRDHVFPRNLYPLGERSSCQLLTVPSCGECNGGYSDDEVAFRNVLIMAGDPPPPPRLELHAGTFQRSLRRGDGLLRLEELRAVMRPVVVQGQPRHMIFPCESPAFVRVMKKVTRGLIYAHLGRHGSLEPRLWITKLDYEIPPEFIEAMNYEHRNAAIVEYWFSGKVDSTIDSVWVVRFFNSVSFLCVEGDMHVSA